MSPARKRETQGKRSSEDRSPRADADHLIASALRMLDTANATAPIPPTLEAIERHTLGAAVLQPLQSIPGMIAEGRWPEALRAINAIRPRLQTIDPGFGSERIMRKSWP